MQESLTISSSPSELEYDRLSVDSDSVCFIFCVLISSFRFLGALSLRPSGRPVFVMVLGCRFISNGKVSSYQVRPLQMSRIVFSLTPNRLATELAVGLVPRVPSGRRTPAMRKMSTACCLESTARGFKQATGCISVEGSIEESVEDCGSWAGYIG